MYNAHAEELRNQDPTINDFVEYQSLRSAKDYTTFSYDNLIWSIFFEQNLNEKVPAQKKTNIFIRL